MGFSRPSLTLRDPLGADHVVRVEPEQSVRDAMKAVVPEDLLDSVAVLTERGTIHDGAASMDEVLRDSPDNAARLTTAMVAG